MSSHVELMLDLTRQLPALVEAGVDVRVIHDSFIVEAKDYPLLMQVLEDGPLKSSFRQRLFNAIYRDQPLQTETKMNQTKRIIAQWWSIPQTTNMLLTVNSQPVGFVGQTDSTWLWVTTKICPESGQAGSREQAMEDVWSKFCATLSPYIPQDIWQDEVQIMPDAVWPESEVPGLYVVPYIGHQTRQDFEVYHDGKAVAAIYPLDPHRQPAHQTYQLAIKGNHISNWHTIEQCLTQVKKFLIYRRVWKGDLTEPPDQQVP